MANNIIDSFLILFTTQVRGNGIQQLNKQTAGVMKNMSGAGNMLKMFFGYDLYTTVRQLIPSLVDASKQMGAMESRFYAITNSSKLAGEELEWVKNQADRLGLEFLKTADNYSIFYSSVAKTMGGGAAREIFTNWAEAFRVLHIDPAKQERVLYALREMSSKGKIYLQDLSNQLGSHIPAAMNIAAKSMGYVGKNAVGNFRKDITAGKVDVQKFLITFSAAMNGAYVSSEKLANAMEKPDAQLGRLAGRWQRFQIALSKAGFEKDLVKSLKLVNALLPSLEKHGHGIYKILKLIAGSLVLIGVSQAGIGLIKTVATVIQLQKALKALYATILLTQLSSGIAVGSGAMAGILGFLLNPALWIPIATAAIIAVLVAGVMFILHKFFPNLESTMWDVWSSWKLDMWDMLFDIENWWKNSSIGKFARGEWFDFQNNNKSEFGNILARQNEAHPNFEAPSFMLATGEFLQRKMMGLTPSGKALRTAGDVGSAIINHYFTPKIDVQINGASEDTRGDVSKGIQDGFGKMYNDMKKFVSDSVHGNKQPKYTPGRPVANPI